MATEQTCGVEAAAYILGMSRATVYRWARDGFLDHTRKGRGPRAQLRFTYPDLVDAAERALLLCPEHNIGDRISEMKKR